MSLQIKIKGKKGISVMIGYVLLITFAIIISIIVYNWMQSYVPSDDVECEDGVSVIIEDYECDISDNGQLNVTLRNNGLFNIDGIIIYGKNETTQEIATIDLSSTFISEEISNFTGGKVIFSQEEKNSMKPNDEQDIKFNLTALPEKQREIKEIEIVPVKYVEVGERNLEAICSESRITENINC